MENKTHACTNTNTSIRKRDTLQAPKMNRDGCEMSTLFVNGMHLLVAIKYINIYCIGKAAKTERI